jgi:O-antigen/teichoic acid export membrane protein
LIKTIGLNFFFSILGKLSIFLSTIYLARVLDPSEYGLLAIGLIFEAFLNLFNFGGIETFFLKEAFSNETHERKVLGVVFWMRIKQSLLLFIFAFITGVLVYLEFNSRIGIYLMISSISFVVSIFGRPNEIVLSKKLKFKPINIANFSKDLLSSCFRILAALLGFGFISFVLGSLLGNLGKSIYLTIINNNYFNIKKDLEIQKQVFSFSKGVFANNFATFVMQNVDRIIMSVFLPINSLGIFQFSRTQSQLVNNILLGSQSSFALSFLSKSMNEGKLANKDFLSSFYPYIAWFSLFVYVTIFYFIDPLFVPIFGENWTEALIIVKIILGYYFIQFFFFPFSSLLTITGFPSRKATIYISFSVFYLIYILIISFFELDILYYAIGFCITYSIVEFITVFFGLRIAGIKIWNCFNFVPKFIPLLFLSVFTFYVVQNFIGAYFITLFLFIITLYWIDVTGFNYSKKILHVLG